MDYTSIKVGQLPTEEISGSDFIPHEVNGLLKKATITDLAAFIGANDAVGFRAVSVPNGGTLPTTDTQEFILVGPGTYNNVGGGSTITVTEELNALVSNGTYWFVGVEIPIDAPPGNAVWGEIVGTLSNQTDLQSLLNLKADLVAGKVPSSQLPSYVDDVVEVADFAALPVSGETGKIYVTLDSGFIYRWTGTIYVRIADEAPTWGAIVGTLSDQTDLQSALNSKEDDIAAGTTAQYWRGDKSWQTLNKSAVGLGNVDNTSDADKPISTATQTALDGKFDDPTGDTTQYIAGDGSLITFPVAGQAGTVVREVRNVSGATITKGTVVYINGASGNKPTIAKALATSDSTSAQTFGIVQADISNNSNGYVVCVGDIIGLNTSAITEGSQLYLSSTTAGAYTTTKQLAPAHLVYIGVVTRSHASLGQIEVKIQNGYELDELHDVAISSKTNNEILAYESSTDLWKNKSVSTILGYTPANDSSVVHIAGTETITGTKTFTQAVKAASFQLSGGTGNSLYYGHTNKLVVANYEVGGGIDFETNGGNVNMILNSNGNLGIGVDPSAWDTAWKVLQLSYGSLYSSIYSNIMAHNLYVAGEDTKYISSNLASQYEQNSGAHWWSTAPTGTAGANVTLTPRMTLTNDGKLGIGIISPNGKLQVTLPTFTNEDTDSQQAIFGSGTNGYGVRIGYSESGNYGVINSLKPGVAWGKLIFQTGGGSVGIGTTSPSNLLSVGIPNSTTGKGISIENTSGTVFGRFGVINPSVDNNTYIGSFSNNDFLLYSNSTERMRIYSDGGIGFKGASTGLYGVNLVNTNSSFTIYATDGGGVTKDIVLQSGGSAGSEKFRFNATGNLLLGTGTDNGYRLWVEGSGNSPLALRNSSATGGRFWKVGPDSASNFIIYNESNTGCYINWTSTSWTGNSDIRLKNIIKNIDNATESLLTLNPVIFSWKTDNTNKENLGLIAQDVEKVFPQVIDSNSDGMLGVRYTDLIPVLIASIKELKAEIEILKNK